MADLLIDTDVFVDHLRGARRLDVGGDHIAYSVVTRCELFAGREDDEAIVRILLAPFAEVPITRSIAERAGRLRRATRVRTPDALIAATALEGNLTLVTRKVAGFSGIEDLRIQSPE